MLVVAGTFKRADTSLSEQAMLMRSLRDANVAKIECDDLRIRGLLEGLFSGVGVEPHHPVVLIGLAGCDKALPYTGMLEQLNPSAFTHGKMSMSYYTDSLLRQTAMELPLEKKAEMLFEPPGVLRLIYCIDDLNLKGDDLKILKGLLGDLFPGMGVEAHHPVMLLGLAGCGKTRSCTGMLKQLDPSVFTNCKMDLSYCSDSLLLQTAMELPLVKKAGELFEPPGKLQLIYHIDGLDMPAVDKYNTPIAIGLIKQKQGYSHWYDRRKSQLKENGNAQYLCGMNPTAGSTSMNRGLAEPFEGARRPH